MKRIKRTGALALAALLLCAVMLPVLPSLRANALEFVPRLTAPEESNGYYTSGNLFWRCGYGMPNCTCYAFGRAYEILGTVPRLSHRDANKWYDYNVEKGYYAYGAVPKPGSVACWTTGAYGHVAFVETVNDDGTITISESHWSGTYFDTRTVAADCGCYAGFQGFIYVGEAADGTAADFSEFAGLRDVGNWAYASIFHRESGKNITVDDEGNVCLSEQNDPTDLRQMWYLTKEETPTGAYQIINAATGKCLDATRRDDEAITGIRADTDNDTPAQRWYLDNSDGIRPVYAGNTVMDLADGSTEGGTDIRMFTYNGSAAQKWGLRIVPRLMQTTRTENHTYELYQGCVSWNEARAFAEAQGGHLVTVTSEEEQIAVNALLKPEMSGLWLGATDEETEGEWKWVTGEPFTFSQWNPIGEPNNKDGCEHYAHLFCASAYWNDVAVESDVVDGFVVEYELIKPVAPVNVAAEATAENTITVTWDAVEGATKYQVYRYDNAKMDYIFAGAAFAEEGETPRYVDKNLENGAVCYYKIAAVKKAGDVVLISEQSTGACAQAVGTPAVPQNVTAKQTADGTVTVSWDEVPGATQYYIYYRNGARDNYVFRGATFASGATPTQFIDAYPNDGDVCSYKVIAMTLADGYTLASEKSAAAKVTLN